MITIEENDKRFFISKSTIPGAGLGIFASKFICKGEDLEVVGVMVDQQDICEQCTHYADDYKFAASEKKSSRRIIPMGFAAIVNHALDKKNANMWMTWLKCPNRINYNSGSLVLRAVRDISINEECLHYYGDQWNDHVHWKEKAIAEIEEDKEEWEKFLYYKLYNLELFDGFVPSDICPF